MNFEAINFAKATLYIAVKQKQADLLSSSSYWYKGARSDSYANFQDFFSLMYESTRRDLLSNTVYTKDLGYDLSWRPILNFKKVIESHCAEVGLSPNAVDRSLSRWAESLPPALLIEPEEWDKKDHIKDALNRINVKNIEHDQFVELMKEWLSSIIRRMRDPKHQNKFVILRGKQGIGKDFCINAMLSGFGRYVDEIDFTQNKTEVNRIIKGLAVAIIPEFDETHKSSISMIKSLVTGKSIKMRDLYKNDAESQQMRTSFISASNFENILRDSSGNRRFVIFDLEHIEHTFELVNADQILAQAFELANEKYRASDEAQFAMKRIIDSETPESSENLLVEEINAHLNSNRFKMTRVAWDEIKHEVKDIGKSYGFGPRSVQGIMIRRGIRKADKDGKYYSASE